MAGKTIYSLLASVLFVQAAFGQFVSNNILNPGANCVCSGIGGANIGASTLGLGTNIGFGNGIAYNGLGLANNYGYGLVNNVGLIGNGVELLGNNVGIFSVSSGSPVYEYPGGVVINSENQIGGGVSVTGNVPFYGAAYYGGDVNSAGEAVLSHVAGPSVSLNGGGCGYGLGGAGAYNTGVAGTQVGITGGLNSGFVGNGIISNGIVGNNGFIGTSGLIGNGAVIGGRTCIN